MLYMCSMKHGQKLITIFLFIVKVTVFSYSSCSCLFWSVERTKFWIKCIFIYLFSCDIFSVTNNADGKLVRLKWLCILNFSIPRPPFLSPPLFLFLSPPHTHTLSVCLSLSVCSCTIYSTNNAYVLFSKRNRLSHIL